MRRSNLLLSAAVSSLLLAACAGGMPRSSSSSSPAETAGYADSARAEASPAAPPAQPGLAAASDGSPAPRTAVASTSAPEAPPAEESAPIAAAKAGGTVAPVAVATATASPVTEAVRPAPSLGVRAGEWDDNANYRDFLGYMKNANGLGIEKIDVSSRRFVVVTDKDGHGVPNCKVTIKDVGGQKTATLTTAASGRAVLFPRALGLGSQLVASTSCQSQSAAEATFDSTGSDGVVKLQLKGARADVSKPAIDVVFVLDTTGSMAEEIGAVKATLANVLANLEKNVSIRVGLVEYKDRGDTFVTKTYALTGDVQSLSRSIAGISASGGGDTPEDVNSGLSVAVNQMKWNDKAVARLAFLIADAPPHLDYQDGVPYAESAKKAAEKGIKVFTVAASGMDQRGQAVFRQIAQVTGGTNMFVLRGGAGPQSTGGGDPTSSCGATHQNYSSGKLDQLIGQKLALEITSLKADPMRIPGLDKDENAKACADRVLIVAR